MFPRFRREGAAAMPDARKRNRGPLHGAPQGARAVGQMQAGKRDGQQHGQARRALTPRQEERSQ